MALYFILYALFYDSLQYLLDSDAVAYLTIARRVATDDWFRSINGLWSPLNSWLLVPFIKNGIDAWTAAKGLNAFFGGVLILQFWSLLKQLKFSNILVTAGTLIVVIPICFFAYFQMFGDVLQLIFALTYIQLCLKEDFLLQLKWVLWASLLMGIGYYAKAYSLVFFVLHFTVLAFFAFRNQRGNKSLVVRNYFLGIIVILLTITPWVIQLHNKYDQFLPTGLAGKLNMSWYINSGKTFKDDIKLLIPPAYDDSPCFWEDPYLSAGELSTPFSSYYHFKRWILRVGHTCLMAIKSVTEISLLFIPIILIFLYRILKKKKVTKVQSKIIWAIIVLPLGYLIMHIETRYIWLSMFLVILLGLYLLQELKYVEWKKRLVLIIFCLSITAYPIFMLFSLQGKNKNLFVLGQELKENDISGKIVTNLKDEGSFWVTCYLVGLNNYTIENHTISTKSLVREMKRYGIEYYIYFNNNLLEQPQGNLKSFLHDRMETQPISNYFHVKCSIQNNQGFVCELKN